MALGKLTARVLARLGLDFDFSLDSGGAGFAAITPTLSLGGRPRVEDVGVLKELGVTHVVSCLEERQRAGVAFLGDEFETLFLPMRDGAMEDIGATFPQFFEFVGRPGAKALVHCEVGVSRSATLATAEVMRSRGMPFYEAYLEVRRRRAGVLPNVGFASQLQRFEHTLFPEPRSDGVASLTRYLREVCNVPVQVDVLQRALELHGYDALAAIRAIFGEVPRVVQGARL